MAIAPTSTLFDEITDFLASAPSLEELIAYKPSEALDQRLQMLMDKNSEGTLTAEDRAEFDEFLRMDHFLTMLKLKAQLQLKRRQS